MALGGQLREARMRLGLTTSEIAATTRMKVQMVDAIEREDFRAMAAPIYGKGFIRLFAQRVGLDPEPLIEEYVELFVNKNKPADPKKPDLVPELQELVPVVEEPKVVEPPMVVEQPMVVEPKAVVPPEEDLFSRVQAQPLAPEEDREEDRPRLSARGPELAAALAAAKESCRSLLRRMAAAIRAGAPSLKVDLKKIRFSEAPLKTIGIATGLLIILILIFSALSRYIRSPGPDKAIPGSDLQLATDPPDPYME